LAADVARAAGVRRFVHVSSMAVHGDEVPERLDESAPLRPGNGTDYGRAKCLAEQAVLRSADQGLSAILIRPARIYGPFSRTFTVRPLRALAEGRLVLAGDADTPSNMVFVDNVVEAIILALNAPDSVGGEAFLISDREQLSWRAFFQYFAEGTAAQLRVKSLAQRAADGAPGLACRWIGGVREITMSSEVRALAKKVLWTDPVGTLPRRLWERSPRLQRRVQRVLGVDAAITYRHAAPSSSEVVEFQINPTLVVTDKAVASLGYEGRVPRDEALRLTRDWARAARLI
jgi:nucleoside-diphosphate-sugar epimerase